MRIEMPDPDDLRPVRVLKTDLFGRVDLCRAGGEGGGWPIEAAARGLRRRLAAGYRTVDGMAALGVPDRSANGSRTGSSAQRDG